MRDDPCRRLGNSPYERGTRPGFLQLLDSIFCYRMGVISGGDSVEIGP